MENATLKPAPYNMRFIWLICLVAAMGGLLFGYDWVVIGGAKLYYEPYFQISDDTPFLRGFAQSSALFGCLLGALVSGMLTDKFGRKRLLILSGGLFTVSALGTALAGNFTGFILYRIIGGIGIGLASNLSPMYIAEISPAESRGKFVSINQLTIVIGILAAQVVNFMIAERVPTPIQLRLLLTPEAALQTLDPGESNVEREMNQARTIVDENALRQVKQAFPDVRFEKEPVDPDARRAWEDQNKRLVSAYLYPTWNGRRGWRWMFGAEILPASLFFALMFFIPESPRWLVKYDKTETAQKILSRVGGDDYAEWQVADIRGTLAREEIAHVNFRDLLEPKLMKIVILGVILAVFQQWCGINVIFNYAQEVFAEAGYEVDDIMFTIVITGVINLLFTFIAIYTVDRIGRRILMLIGAGGLTGIYAVLGTGYLLQSRGVHMLILVVLAIACYAMTLAPITWVVISEIFPNRIRGAAMSVAVFSLWVGCAALTLSFPYLKSGLGAHSAIYLYGIVCVGGFFYILRQLPETKGKTLEAVERELVD